MKPEHMKQNHKAYCSRCAFNGPECIAIKKRLIPCWAKCTSIEELNKRYKEMTNYCTDKDVRKRIRTEYKECLERLERASNR